MFGLFKSVVDLAADVVQVVAAPVEIVADRTGSVVEPVAEVAKDLVADFKSLKD